MSTSSEDDGLKRRYREFLDLMPLTISIAGLPPSEGTWNFSTEQMEVRTRTLANAFKLARLLLRESITGQSGSSS